VPVLCGARLTGAAANLGTERVCPGMGYPVVNAAAKGLRATTMADYEYYVRNDIAFSALGRMKLIDIRRYHVQEFVAHQGRTRHAGRTATRDDSGTIFTSAVKDELISANPARGADRPRLDREPDQGHVFTMGDGGPWPPRTSRGCSRHSVKGRMRRCRSSAFHGLTHCYASLMIGSGADICRCVKAARARLDLDHRRGLPPPDRQGCTRRR
jgi:hypothetical protein